MFKFSQMGKLTPVDNKWDMIKSIYFRIEGKRAIYGVLPNPSVGFKCDREECTKIRVNPTGYVSNCTIQLKYVRDFSGKSLKEKIRPMREIVKEKESRNYSGFRHRQKYYDFWRFGIVPKSFPF